MNAKTTGTFLLGALCGAGAAWSWKEADVQRGAPSPSTLRMSAAAGAPPGRPFALPSAAPSAALPRDSSPSQSLLAAAEELEAEQKREIEARVKNDLAVWAPFYASLLGLSPSQSRALGETETPAGMTRLLHTDDFLTQPQMEKLAAFEKERTENYAEITAQRQLAWVQEHLPLTGEDKDRLWQALSEHSLEMTNAGGDLSKRQILTDGLRARIEAILPRAAADVALSYLQAGLEEPPPGMEMEEAAEDTGAEEPAAENTPD